MKKVYTCNICLWIEEIKSSPKFLIKEFTTGFAVISKFQYFKGYTLFLCKDHVFELHQLTSSKRDLFLQEMAQVGEAVYKAVHPDKLNYELLGNSEPHLHWHIIPRRKKEKDFNRPVWIIDKNIREAKNTYPSPKEVASLKKKILENIY